jgi:hypothetical protein
VAGREEAAALGDGISGQCPGEGRRCARTIDRGTPFGLQKGRTPWIRQHSAEPHRVALGVDEDEKAGRDASACEQEPDDEQAWLRKIFPESQPGKGRVSHRKKGAWGRGAFIEPR